jgi:hypothetical protein
LFGDLFTGFPLVEFLLSEQKMDFHRDGAKPSLNHNLDIGGMFTIPRKMGSL